MVATTKTTGSSELIYPLLAKVMGDVHAVPKDQTNQHQRFNFRGIDDVYPVVRKALLLHGCSIIPFAESVDIDRQVLTSRKGEEQSWCKVVVLMRFTIYAPDGSHVVARFYGEGNDTSDKAISKAHSNAYKKFAFDTFCIPTGEPDPDHDDIQNATPTPPPVDPNDPNRPVTKQDKEKLIAFVSQSRADKGFTSGTALDVITAIGKDVLKKRCSTFGEFEQIRKAIIAGKYDLDTGEKIPTEKPSE